MVNDSSSLEVKCWFMLSLSIAITPPMLTLIWIHLKVGVNASLYGAITLIRSNVLKLPTQAKYVCVLWITLFQEKIAHFCFHHVKDKVRIDIEPSLTQITILHWNLCILLYSATHVGRMHACTMHPSHTIAHACVHFYVSPILGLSLGPIIPRRPMAR